MKLSKLALAGALAIASSASFAAGGPLDLSTGSTYFGDTPTAGGFADTFTFTLGTTSTVNAGVLAVTNGTQNVDFSFVALTGPSGLFQFTKTSGDPFELWTLNTTTLAAGSYSLSVIGTNSASIGSYSGNIGVTPAVPEPETYALFFAGLGAIGFLTRRRNNG